MVSDGARSGPAERETSRQPRADDSPLAVSSRRRALDRLRAAVEAGRPSPVLITGEPGAGKTWLARPASLAMLRAVAVDRDVDLTTAMNALDFLRLDRPCPGPAPVRPPRDGPHRGCRRSCTTTPSTAGAGCWSSTKPIAARRSSGTRSRPSSINSAGRVGSRPWSFWARPSWLVELGHARLRRLGLELRDSPPPPAARSRRSTRAARIPRRCRRSPTSAMLEELHRDARGNPRALLRLAESPSRRQPGSIEAGADRARAAAAARVPAAPAVAGRASSAEAAGSTPAIAKRADAARRPARANAASAASAPSLIPSRPPIRDRGGTGRGGMGGRPGSRDSRPPKAPSSRYRRVAGRRSAVERRVDRGSLRRPPGLDRVDTKVKNEPASTASRSTARPPAMLAEPIAGIGRPALSDRRSRSRVRAGTPPPGIRAEAQHEFAPYSQLFTRLRQSKQP